jgi:hypothetical protein
MATQVAAERRSTTLRSEIKIPQLPLREHGLTNVPAIPLDIVGMMDQLVKLGVKVKQRQQALQGLSKTVTIGGSTAPAYAFLFGREGADAQEAISLERLHAFRLKAQEAELVRTASDDLTTRSLDDPTQ